MNDSPAKKSFRILMYCPYFPPEYSGAALQAIALAKALRSRGHHIEFLTERRAAGDPLDHHQDFKVHRVRCNRHIRHNEIILWSRLFWFFWRHRHDFDIIHSHGAYYRQTIIGPIARFLGMHSIAKASLAKDDLHNNSKAIVRFLHRWMLRKIDAYIAISRPLASEFEHMGLPRNKIYLLPNGVDTERFQPVSAQQKRRLRHALGLPAERVLALFVGVFDRRKNIAWLAHHWVTQQGFTPGAVLVAVGPTSREPAEAPIKQELRTLAQQNPDWLCVHEPTETIELFYQACDMLILPSFKEGLPNCILEALACRLPCVVSDNDWHRELIDEGETGAIFANNDTASLAKALERAMSICRYNTASTAFMHTAQRFSLPQLATDYEKLYYYLTR